MQLIDSKLDLELCAFICGWHDFDKSRKDGREIIDLHLSNLVKGKKYFHINEILQDIKYFLDINEIKNNRHIHQKLTAHYYFIKKSEGEHIPFPVYMKNTIGFEPFLYSDRKIKALQENMEELLAPYGLTMQEDVRRLLNEKDKNISGNLHAVFEAHHQSCYTVLKNKTDIRADFAVNYTEINEENNLRAYITGNGKLYNVELNKFNLKYDRQNEIRYLASHELTGHGMHFTLLQQQYELGNMPRYMTYITVHEPLMFATEGLAQTLFYFCPEMKESPITDAFLSVDRLRKAVVNNAGYMTNMGYNFQDCLKYSYENATCFTKQRTEALLRAVTDNAKIGYNLCYGPSLESFYQAAKSHPDKYSFLRSVYNNYMAPDQIQAQLKHPIQEFV